MTVDLRGRERTMREMAEGTRPFEPDALLERLADLPRGEYDRLDAATRRVVGYYLCGKRRAEQLREVA